ncbi:MAG TPA: hypothetical protein VK536_09480 [Candidatus Limnocylindrales bacterium]|nr:hypothetical protein [Candidatus Limnocylindrales bacterium]
MTIDPQLSHKISLVIHSLGLSCLGGAIFLQILVFSDITLQGYFRAVETNSTVLAIEVTLTFFAVVYFLYVYQRIIRSSLKS